MRTVKQFDGVPFSFASLFVVSPKQTTAAMRLSPTFYVSALVALSSYGDVSGSFVRGATRGAYSEANGTLILADESLLVAPFEHQDQSHRRALVEEHNFFAPLTCNAPFCSVKRSNWSIEDYSPETEMVLIPCGHCIMLDYMFDQVNTVTPQNITLRLPFGIDIQGALHIYGNAHMFNRLTIVTPFVRVQGKLSIFAHRTVVTGIPNVHFVFTDDASVDSSFVPAGNNTYACSATKSGTTDPTPCDVGPKSLVVAGGQLDIWGLAQNCSTWVHLYDVIHLGARSDIIVADEGIIGCWGIGSEILITSHTTDFESAMLHRLIAHPVPYGAGLVRLQLNGMVVPSVTVLHNDSFAVEVALLSRNILFQGARDSSDALMGGHLMVMNTPFVAQRIQGVEFRNFGRQGECCLALETMVAPWQYCSASCHLRLHWICLLCSHARPPLSLDRRNRPLSSSFSLVQ
jgi:hypothetical protein